METTVKILGISHFLTCYLNLRSYVFLFIKLYNIIWPAADNNTISLCDTQFIIYKKGEKLFFFLLLRGRNNVFLRSNEQRPLKYQKDGNYSC